MRFLGGGNKTLLIVGANGHGKVVYDVAQRIGIYEEIYFLDDDIKLMKENKLVIGLSGFAFEHKNDCDVIIAIGNPIHRKRIQENFEQNGVNLVTLIHPESVISEKVAQIGSGSVIMAGAVIQADTKIGKSVIINTSSSIDHECKIGNYAHISVGSHLAGNVEVGDGTWIGIGAIISNNVFICNDVMVGAGAVVVEDIIESGTYVGVPAKRIK